MTDDPFVREVGRVEDGQGRVLIVGVNYDAVTLRVTDPGDPGDDPVAEFGMTQQEELGQQLIAAVWQAAWQRRQMDVDTDRAAAQGGAP
jgi:hypothetical protein